MHGFTEASKRRGLLGLASTNLFGLVPKRMEDTLKKAGIAIDEWKLPIFQRRLEQAGYTFKNTGHLTEGTLVLQVETTNLEALGVVVKAANDEAAQTGAPK